MNSFDELDRELTQLLGLAARSHLLGLLLRNPGGGTAEVCRALAGELQDDALRGAAEAVDAGWEGAYLELLGPGGSVSPREIAYRGWTDPGKLLSELMASYQAFAFRTPESEPPDHASVELDFAGYLLMKQAYALAGGGQAAAALTAEGFDSFFQNHLKGFLDRLAPRLEACEVGYLRFAAQGLHAWLDCFDALQVIRLQT